MLADRVRVRIGELNSEGDTPNALSLKSVTSIMLYQKHCPSTQVKIISSRKASLNFQAHWNFCSCSVSIRRDRLLVSYLLSCPMNTVLRYLLTPSSILPASIYAQLSASCLFMYWNIETPHTAFPGKMKSGNVAGSAWEWLTFLFSIWQEVSPLGLRCPDYILPGEDIRLSLADQGFQIREET